MRRFSVLLLAVFAICQTDASARAAGKKTGIPRFDAAVQRAAVYLRGAVAESRGSFGEAVLAGYALFKTGDPIESPAVASAIRESVGRSSGTSYAVVDAYHHIYVAGVDAMLLSDVDPEQYKGNLQTIANYIQSAQRADGSWSNGATEPGDVSMCQYGVLGLWAAQRAGCTVSPQKVDLAADFLMKKGNPDGGWGYRPGTTGGPGAGQSTHNMTMAASGTLLVARLMLHGPKSSADKSKPVPIFGVLEKVDDEEGEILGGKAWPGYSAQHSTGELDGRSNRGLGWNESRFSPVSTAEHNMYFYYCIERAASIGDLKEIAGREWYTTYGDGMLTLQNEDGGFNTHTGRIVGTSFALLYFMKSTQQILDAQYGRGLQHADRGNPFGDKIIQREPTELDRLIEDIWNLKIDVDEAPIEIADEIVRSVTSINDPEELVGKAEELKSLMKHPNAEVRKAACWALGRTGDFKLIPLMLDGIRDPNLDVNVEAVGALRYITRKPNGFGETLNPMEGLDKAPAEERLRVANEWRQKVVKQWSAWYFAARPYEETNRLDELQVKVPLETR